MNNYSEAFGDYEGTMSDEELYDICAKVEEDKKNTEATTIGRAPCDVCKTAEVNVK